MTSTGPHRLKALLDDQGLKSRHVAAWCDVDPSTAYRWTRGADIPSAHAPTIATELGVSPAYLMGWADTDETCPAGAAA